MMNSMNLSNKKDSKIKRGGIMKTLSYLFVKNGIEHEFELELEDIDIENAIRSILGNDCVIDETNIDELFDNLKNEIAIYYESKAYAEFEDDLAYRRDVYSYYGVSRADFA